MAEETNIKGAFGSIKSEKSYLDKRVDVAGQRRKISSLRRDLLLLKRQVDSTDTKSDLYQKYLASYKAKQNEINLEQSELNRIEASARSDFRKAYKKETGFVSEKAKSKAESETKKTETLEQKISILQNQLKRAQDLGASTVQIRSELEDLINQKNKTGQYTPAVEAGKQEGTAQTLEDINKLAETAPDFLFNKINDKQRKAISQSLKDAGYNVPVTGVYNDFLKDAYVQALLENNERNLQTNRSLDLTSFLLEKEKEKRSIEGASGAGGAGGVSPGVVSISTASEAAGIIERGFEAELGRLPTPKELASFTNDLVKEEKKFSSVQRPIKRVGPDGKEYIEYVGGIDKNQFIANKVRSLPEYNERKKAARTLTVDELARTARSNGLDLNKDFGDSVKNWVKRVENGEDVDIFKNLIRGTAKLGMPQNVQSLMDSGLDLEAIYAPYKRVMASTLEVTPDSINLNDATLRTAVGPDKEMSIYDFEKNLRRDNRWQYTNKAREEVADATLKVLRDFGFTG
jgi:hypothetical protein